MDRALRAHRRWLPGSRLRPIMLLMGKPKGESKGLAYLRKVRPEAMEHLLRFFGEAGRHLDPKTRFLISIVTKVINFSPRGLQQYVPRALKEGATPDEIIDAVLLSYPCAGLVRVVDAIDVILDMGIEGFERLAEGGGDASAGGLKGEEARGAPAAPGREPAGEPGTPREEAASGDGWVEVGSVEDLAPDGRLCVVAGDRQIALFRVGDEVLAIDHLCPHRGGPLAEGFLRGEVVICPLHRWSFNLRTGLSPDHPGARVRTYDVRLEGGRILVRL